MTTPVRKGLTQSAAYLAAARLEAGGIGPASVRREAGGWSVNVPSHLVSRAQDYLARFVR